jgi:pentatricopeptide repeat protein
MWCSGNVIVLFILCYDNPKDLIETPVYFEHCVKMAGVRFHQCGKVVNFCLWMQQKTKPSLVAYNMLIDACGKKGMHEEAVRFYVEVMEAGYHPSSVTYTSLIAAVAQGGRYEKAEELYRRMLRDGVKPTSHTFATMINAYSLRGWTKAGHEVGLWFQNSTQYLSFHGI